MRGGPPSQGIDYSGRGPDGPTIDSGGSTSLGSLGALTAALAFSGERACSFATSASDV